MEVEVDTERNLNSSREPKWTESYDSEVLDLEQFLGTGDKAKLDQDNRNNMESNSPRGSEPDLGDVTDNSQNVEKEPSFSDCPDLEDSPKQQDEVKLEVKHVKQTRSVANPDPNTNPQNDLPEGWVRCGKGLKAEFLNTPRGSEDNTLESKNLFMNFTHSRKPLKSQHSLQNALMSLDRNAVRQLKNTTTTPKPTRQHSNKFELNNSDHYPVSSSKLANARRCSTPITKVNSTKLVKPGLTYRNLDLATDVLMLKSQHKEQVDNTKQNMLTHVEDLVRKYRELAVDAVNAARNEQKRCQEECKLAYSTAYNACLKYEKDLKNTIRTALKEYQHNNLDTNKSLLKHNNDFHKQCQDLLRSSRESKSVNHVLLRKDLSHDYQVSEQLLANFEPKVMDKFNSLVKQLSLYLEDNFNFSHSDSSQFVKSVISNHLG